MHNTHPNKLLLSGIKSRNYELIQQAINLGAPFKDKSVESNELYFKSWNNIIKLNDVGIIELIYATYPFKNGYHFSNLLSSIILKQKESFDFFLNKCVSNNANLSENYGILLANTCNISPLITYEKDIFEKDLLCNYFLEKLIENNIDLNSTVKHPLLILSNNSNFSSWVKLFEYIKKDKNYSFENYESIIYNSFSNFLNTFDIETKEIKFFFNNFDNENLFIRGLKKISHPSYTGEDKTKFCLSMYEQFPDLFLKKIKTIGKNNPEFVNNVRKISLFDKINNNLDDKKLLKIKGNKI